MPAKSQRTHWPGPEYVVRQRFRAPLRFVFDWCTDFSPDDPTLEKDEYTRRVVAREPRRVVYEDLKPTPQGWFWSRQEVWLRPPSAWHMESSGNRRDVIADYRLREAASGVVELELRWRRRPGVLKFERPPKRTSEREGRIGWQHFARALERDYRNSTRSNRRRGR